MCSKTVGSRKLDFAFEGAFMKRDDLLWIRKMVQEGFPGSAIIGFTFLGLFLEIFYVGEVWQPRELVIFHEIEKAV